MKFIERKKNGDKRTLKILGFIKINYIKNKLRKKDFVENVFKKNSNKKVLLSYITTPFIKGLSRIHTNFSECMAAAEIFDNLGFQVDVVSYNKNIGQTKLEEYEICYGFGESYNLAMSNPDIKTIYYGTGCCNIFSNVETMKRIRDFYNKHHRWMPNCGRIDNSATEIILNFSDIIIALGNDFVKNTYKFNNNDSRLRNLNCFYYDSYNIDIDKKDFKKIKNNFIYIGSTGTLHKGLDIVLDIFKRRTDLNLTICGSFKKESNFIDYYKDVFNNKYPNIKYCGFVDIDSDLFKNIMDNNIAVVFPTACEGGSAALLNVMANGGLIPISSNRCSLNIEQYGFVFDKLDEETVEQYIDKFLEMSENELKELSINVKSETREIYSYENYKKNLNKIISDEIKRYNK